MLAIQYNAFVLFPSTFGWNAIFIGSKQRIRACAELSESKLANTTTSFLCVCKMMANAIYDHHSTDKDFPIRNGRLQLIQIPVFKQSKWNVLICCIFALAFEQHCRVTFAIRIYRATSKHIPLCHFTRFIKFISSSCICAHYANTNPWMCTVENKSQCVRFQCVCTK